VSFITLQYYPGGAILRIHIDMQKTETISPTLSDIDQKISLVLQTDPPEIGSRHSTIFYVATYLLGHALPADIVTAILEMWNGSKLTEPLPKEQIRYIVHAARKTRRRFD